MLVLRLQVKLNYLEQANFWGRWVLFAEPI